MGSKLGWRVSSLRGSLEKLDSGMTMMLVTSTSRFSFYSLARFTAILFSLLADYLGYPFGFLRIGLILFVAFSFPNTGTDSLLEPGRDRYLSVIS